MRLHDCVRGLVERQTDRQTDRQLIKEKKSSFIRAKAPKLQASIKDSKVVFVLVCLFVVVVLLLLLLFCFCLLLLLLCFFLGGGGGISSTLGKRQSKVYHQKNGRNIFKQFLERQNLVLIYLLVILTVLMQCLMY